MKFSIANNLLSGARLLESPNQSERPADTEIDLLVIHNISLPPGEYGNRCIDQLFCNQLDAESHPFFEEIADLKVSSHLLIDRQGGVTQYVPFDRKAWHAGESVYSGRSNCNDFSIGIELEGSDFEAFAEAQYDSLILITNLLLEVYPCLILDRIVGHSDIAAGRKTDPGPFFNWAKVKSALKQAGNRRAKVNI
jgi:N-acetyl-anhydromuramoyl-L-alanine amidase